MKITIETKDYIEAIKPFRNGCAFKVLIEDRDIKIDFGCYCLVNLLTGAQEFFKNAIRKNNNKPVSITTFNNEDNIDEIWLAIHKNTIDFCEHCSGTVLVKPSSNKQ